MEFQNVISKIHDGKYHQELLNAEDTTSNSVNLQSKHFGDYHFRDVLMCPNI